MTTTIVVHDHIVGDTHTPIGAQLFVDNDEYDLTGKSVQFRMVADDGTVKVDWATASLVSAAEGKVQYDFASGDVDTAGVYWGWFRVGDGSEWDTFPKADPDEDGKARGWKIRINSTT